MNKRVVLKIGQGTFETGFSVGLQLGWEDSAPTVEIPSHLPPMPELQACCRRWQASYRRLGVPYRLEPKASFIKNVSRLDDCVQLANQLHELMNHWLADNSFRVVREKLLEQLSPNDTIRFLLQTSSPELEQLPWHLWDFFDRYPKAELAFCASSYEQVISGQLERNEFRILAILGNSQGLDVLTDQALLKTPPNAYVEFLREPDLQTLNERLWDIEGWDILFFAGHSSSAEIAADPRQRQKGILLINQTESLTISQIRYALKKASRSGLKIAIFNSCDGLGLAHALAELHIPQILVMRELVPDQVAHAFLRYFLDAFSRPELFYLAVREAREKLQGLEEKYPCASWLPTIYQNPAVLPPIWPTPQPIFPHNFQELAKQTYAPVSLKQVASSLLIGGTTITLILGIRLMGWMQSLELLAFDQLLRLRPSETFDGRITLITIDSSDIRIQGNEHRQGSLSDASLEKLLAVLEPYEPRVIALDIYRDYGVNEKYPELEKWLKTRDNFIAVCKSSDSRVDDPGIAPPNEVPQERTGFSDFLEDSDGILRRHLLAMSPEATSPCQSSQAFSTQIARYYLDREGVSDTATEDGKWQIGESIIDPLTPHFGGYRNLDTRGYQILLNYRSLDNPDTIADHIPLQKALNGEFQPEAIHDRIVLIGTVDRSYSDYWLTPFSRHWNGLSETSGLALQAQMVSQVVSLVQDQRSLLRSWPEWVEMLWITGWGLIGGLLASLLQKSSSCKSSTLKLVLFLLPLQGSLGGICWLFLVRTGYWIPLVPAALALLATAGAIHRIVNIPNQINSTGEES